MFINLTPHTLVIRTPQGDLEIDPSGIVARVAVAQKVVRQLGAIPIVENTFGDVEGLPAPQGENIYLVSAMVLSAVAGRTDVFAPDTGSTAIRNDKGHIVAVTRLVAK